MAKLKFHLSQLEKHLKCTDCHNHLTVPPIVVVSATGEYKCGRCSLTGQDRTGVCRTHPKAPAYKTAVRDLPYEELARDLQFPCKMQKYGCEVYRKFQQLAEHEEECPISHNTFMCPMTYCEFRYCGLSFIFEHYQSKHQAEMCVKKWHSHVFTIPTEFNGITDRVFFSSDNQIVFVLLAIKAGLEFTFTLRSLGTNRLFQFEIKPGKFRNNSNNSSSRKSETLLSDPSKNGGSPVKLVLEQDEELEGQCEFQVDFVGKAKKQEDLAMIPVKESDLLRCAKCHKYLSVKPVVATRSGFECGYCYKKTGSSDGVRLKAYENLAEMVMFPCEEPGCEKSFGIGEMKTHRETHKLTKNTIK